MRWITWFVFSQLLFLAALCPDARAQNMKGAFRVGLETSLFSWESDTLTPEGSDVDVTQTTTLFGIGPTVFGACLGYGASETVNVGTRLVLEIGSTSISADAAGIPDTSLGDADMTTVAMLPYLEYVFAPGATSRGFLGPTLGFLSRSSGTEGIDVSMTAFVGGALLGGHFFISDSVSLDPGVDLLFLIGSEEEQSDAYGTFNSDLTGILITGVIGISAWPGAARARPESRAPEPDFHVSHGGAPGPRAAPPMPAQRAPSARAVPPIEKPTGEILSAMNLSKMRVEVAGIPATHPDLARMRIVRTGLRPELSKCEQVDLVIDNTEVQLKPLHYKVEAYGRGVMEVAQVNIEPSVLVDMEHASSVTVRVCTLQSEFDQVNHYKLKRFVETFRNRAPAGSVPLEPSAPPEAPAEEGEEAKTTDEEKGK
jgi:hypothetical protein